MSIEEHISENKKSYDDLIQETGLSRPTIRQHLKKVEDIIIEKDKYGKKYFYKEDTENTTTDNNSDIGKVLTAGDKQKATENSRKLYNDMRNAINKIKKLDKIDYGVYEKKYGDIVPVLYITDIHIGSVEKDENDNLVYESDTAREKINNLYKETVKKLDGKKPNEIKVAMLGDMIENDIIYNNQRYEIDVRPFEQVKYAVKTFAPILKGFKEEYGAVDVYTVRGNHGRISDEAHEEDNWDNIFYHMLDMTLSEEDNIRINIGNNGWNDFEVKGKKIGINHGKHLHHQGSTSAGENKFLQQMVKRDLDEIHIGHYHERKSEEILDKMAYWHPSTKESGKFAGKHGFDSVPSQQLIVYDDDGATELYTINLSNDESKKV